MAHVVIETTTMGFRLPISKRGEIKGTSLSIGEFARKFEHRSYDRMEGHWVILNEYFHFDRDNETCYFPRFELSSLTNFLTSRGVTFEIKELPTVDGKHVNFYMLPHVGFKNDKQKNAVEFLTSPSSGNLRGLGLQTGTGKTAAFIMALQKLHRRSMTTMTSRLEQWVKEIQSFTTLEEDDIYVIQGVGSLTKLFTKIDKDIHPKVILASTKTIRLYLEYGPTYQHLPHPSLMCEKLGIGIVGTDEYHEHFYTNFLIGIMLNPDIFIPITATFSASDPFVKNIFDQFIPKNVQFVGGEYDKYVNVTAYTYRGGNHLIKPYHYMSRQGYSQQMFEKFLLTAKGRKVLDPLINDAILPIIRTHYIDIAEKGEKLLFLCASTALCDHFETVFRREFNSKTVSSFYTGRPTTVLEKYDIIISTPGSAGTGRDVKNLRTCFVFENTGSEIRNLQFIGRLRPFPAVKNTPEYTYISLSAIPQHAKYSTGRAMLYGSRALNFKHRSI